MRVYLYKWKKALCARHSFLGLTRVWINPGFWDSIFLNEQGKAEKVGMKILRINEVLYDLG
jgi:hypothetical protein